MNKVKIFALTFASFTVGLVELLIGGILPTIANDLHISISAAGQLITVFALVYAISGPLLLVMTRKFERKRLYIVSLIVFAAGCLIAFFSPSYAVLMTSRVLTAMSGALITVLSLNIAVAIVPKVYQARVIGIILMGVSAAIVLGVPLGVLISDFIGWRFLFLLIALLTALVILFITFTIRQIEPEKVTPIKTLLSSLKQVKIITAHLVTCFVLASHYTMYAYFAPFLESIHHATVSTISMFYFIFGISAVLGNIVFGYISDRLGVVKTIVTIVALFSLMMFSLPFTTVNMFVFIMIVIIWGLLSWGISPPLQSYLIQSAPDTADIQQSVNLTFLQFGIAAGSAVGGFVYEQTNSFYTMSFIGGILALFALIFVLISISRRTERALISENEGGRI